MDDTIIKTISTLVSDVNALKGKSITEIEAGLNITIDRRNPKKLKISSTGTSGSPGSSGTIYVEKTHAQLFALKDSSSLEPGSVYAITNFKYVADQPDFESNGSPKTSVATKTGADFETIVLTATSTNTFQKEAHSVEFPDDTLYFDIDFVETEVMGEPAKGRITYREDIDGNSADFDFRNALFKRYESSTGSGIFNQYKDNGEASEELPLFLNYGTAIIKKNKIQGVDSLGALLSYPFKEANIVFKSDTLCIGNNLGKGARCHTFGDGTVGAISDTSIGWIFGNDNRNFEAKGNCNNFTVGNNNNSASFKTGVDGFSLGSNNSNINFGSGISNVVIGDNNTNWYVGNDVTGLGAWEGGDGDMSGIVNLHFGSRIDCATDFTQPITTANNPELYGNDVEKWISNAGFDGVANAHYLHYYNGNTIAYQRVGSTPTGEKYAVKTVGGVEADNTGNASIGGSYIPLSGTEVGSPVTGTIKIEGDNGNQINSDFDDKTSGIQFNGANTSVFANDNITGYGTGLLFDVTNVDINASNPSSRGLISTYDYTANITDLDYVQKKYVDAKNSNHTIYTPTTEQTISIVNGEYSIVNPAGTLLALTINLPSSPTNNNTVQVKFTQGISTLTWANGTVASPITTPVLGSLIQLVYDSATSTWY